MVNNANKSAINPVLITHQSLCIFSLGDIETIDAEVKEAQPEGEPDVPKTRSAWDKSNRSASASPGTASSPKEGKAEMYSAEIFAFQFDSVSIQSTFISILVKKGE